jgi:hypothetical protein
MDYKMHFSKPVPVDYLLSSIVRLLGFGNNYEKCVCPDGTIEIKDPNALSPQSCMSGILHLKGLDGNHGQESHRLYEVTFNWSNPRNMPVLEKTEEYRELLKKVEELNEFNVNVWS